MQPSDQHIELVLATEENTKQVGWLINDSADFTQNRIQIPFYSHVTEGAIIADAQWDDPVVRMAKVKWSDSRRIMWLERHMNTTQGFMMIGLSPGLLILGEPTHDRTDLTEEDRMFPDYSRLRGYIIPPGCGIIIKKGVWHDFPISVGPDLTIFTINTREVVEALMSMKAPAPMDVGDCYKIRISDRHPHVNLHFPDPRPFLESLRLG